MELVVKSQSYYDYGEKNPYMIAKLVQNPLYMQTVYTCESGHYIRPTVGAEIENNAFVPCRYKHEQGWLLLKVSPEYGKYISTLK